jgi:ketosteroid isomerase-like protein
MSDGNVEIVRRLSEEFTEGAEGWMDVYSPDVELNVPHRGVNDPVLYTGPEGVTSLVDSYTELFSELRWDRELLIDAGDRVVGLFHQRGRSKQDGSWVEAQVGGVFHLHEGKVVRVQNFPSWSAALEAVRPAE